MNLKKLTRAFNNSMLGYLPAKVAEGVIGIVTIRVYTNLFAKSIYGEYSILNSTIAIIFLLTLGWMLNSANRFAQSYMETEDKKKEFYSTVYIGILLVYLAVMVVGIGLVAVNPHWLKVYGSQELLALVFVLLSYGFTQILMGILLYTDHRSLNVILLIGNILSKLLMTLVFYHFIGESVMSIFLASGLVDFICGTIAFIALKSYKYVSISYFNKEILAKFLNYGYPLIGLSATMIVLNMSGRYVILYFWSKEEVGAYMANFTIASAIFTMIMMGLSRGVYPKLIKSFTEKNYVRAAQDLKTGMLLYLAIALPSAVGLAVLHQQVSAIFVNERYGNGSIVIGLVAFGMFFYGLAEYSNKGWELSANTMPILVQSIFAAIVNLALNILLVPKFGFGASALATFLAFLSYFCISYIRRNSNIPLHLKLKDYGPIVLAAATMGILVYLLNGYMRNTLLNLLINVSIGIIIYFSILFGTGFLKRMMSHLRGEYE